nr:hypothetical protein [Tanacetum cinerariifolium]
RVVPRNYDPKGARSLIASRFPTPPLACQFFNPEATEKACPHHGFFELHQLDTSSALVSSPNPAPVKAGQNVQNQLANLTDMLSKFMSSNTASSSGSGTLSSNTIANPKEELKGITTRSVVAYQGPINSIPSKVVKQGTEVTKDQVQAPSSQSTAPVQPPVSQSETQALIFKPVVAPVSAPMPNVKSSIPYPSRRDNERRHDQANEKIEK